MALDWEGKPASGKVPGVRKSEGPWAGHEALTLAQLLGLLGSLFFLGQALTAMLVYVWSRRSPRVRVNFFGLLTFQAPFLPWALMGFSMLLGNSILVDLLGEPAVHPAFPKQAVRDLRVCLARAPRPPALDLSSVPTASSCPHSYPVLPAPQTSQPIGFTSGLTCLLMLV